MKSKYIELSARSVLMASTVLGVMVAPAAIAQDVAAPNASPTEVVVTKRLEKTARAEQKAALNIVNIQPAETIEKYPDFNGAEALGRVPGVSLSEDTGEGRFVEIRGIDGNLNGATFGGVVLLNTQPGGTYFGGGGRAVEMDTVPIGSVDRVEVIKSGRPDMDAEGLGGVVELTPRSAANLRKPFFEGTLGGGYEALRKSWAPLRAEIAAGARFGFGDKGLIIHDGSTGDDSRAGFIQTATPFSVVVTASQFNNRQSIDDVEAAYGADNGGATDGKDALKVYDSLELRRYNYYRRRFGYGMDFNFTPNSEHSYYLRANVAGYVEHVLRDREVLGNLEFDTAGNPLVDVAGAGQTSYWAGSGNRFQAPSTEVAISTRDEQEVHRNTILAAGGADRFGDVKLDYQLSYSRSTYHKEYDRNSTFNNVNNDSFGITYDTIDNSNHPTFTVPAGINLNDATQYTLKKYTNQEELDSDHETGAQVNVAFPAHWLGNDELKFGLRTRLRRKTEATDSFTYGLTAGQSLSAFSPTPVYGYYNNWYTVGPFPSIYALRAQSQSAAASGTSALADVFDDKENISAAYGQYTTILGPWSFLGGVRVEKTEGSYTGTLNNAPAQFKTNYTDLFPSAQLRYSFSDTLIGRLTYSTGIGRPGFNQLSGGAVDLGALTVNGGNPNLKPTTGNNFDATVEWYLPNSGVLQFGLFDKQFHNYVETRIFKGPYPGEAGTFTYSSYANINGAWARGAEAAYNQKFTMLPGLWSGLGLDANLTVVDSRAELRPGETKMLPGTSHMTGNLALFYEKNGLSLRLASEYVGKTLFGAGGNAMTDIYEDKRLTADFYAGYDINPTYKVYFTAKNLTNEKLRFYEGTPDRPIQREFYDLSYEFGIKAKF